MTASEPTPTAATTGLAEYLDRLREVEAENCEGCDSCDGGFRRGIETAIRMAGRITATGAPNEQKIESSIHVGLTEVLAAHLWADRPGQTCGCGWEADSHWMTDRDALNRVEQHLNHQAEQIAAHRAARLSDPDVVEAAAEAMRAVTPGTIVWEDLLEDARDMWRADAHAALAAAADALRGEA